MPLRGPCDAISPGLWCPPNHAESHTGPEGVKKRLWVQSALACYSCRRCLSKIEELKRLNLAQVGDDQEGEQISGAWLRERSCWMGSGTGSAGRWSLLEGRWGCLRKPKAVVKEIWGKWVHPGFSVLVEGSRGSGSSWVRDCPARGTE